MLLVAGVVGAAWVVGGTDVSEPRRGRVVVVARFVVVVVVVVVVVAGCAAVVPA